MLTWLNLLIFASPPICLVATNRVTISQQIMPRSHAAGYLVMPAAQLVMEVVILRLGSPQRFRDNLRWRLRFLPISLPVGVRGIPKALGANPTRSRRNRVLSDATTDGRHPDRDARLTNSIVQTLGCIRLLGGDGGPRSTLAGQHTERSAIRFVG